jgi:hypothetical protein
MSTLALCPSRGRPDAAHETLASFEASRRDPRSRIVFIVDSDDPTLPDYPTEHTHVVEPKGYMGAALNTAAKDPVVLGDATSVGMIGDDNRFLTPGWDLILDGWLAANIGVAYGDDGFQHERLPTSWWVSRPLVNVFGMADPEFHHLYMDNWWKSLAEGAKCLRYFPEVEIEHLHPLAGKAEDDETYRRGNSSENARHDRHYFHRWEMSGRDRAVRRAKAIIDSARPKRVLADWHHPALWESLSILFEDRFGWELYSMGGLDWTRHGWALHNGTPGWATEDYLCQPSVDRGTHGEVTGSEYPERVRKVVTWQQAQDIRWDFVLASVSEHQRPFSGLARDFGARFIHQVGNARHAIERRVPQITLASSVVPRGTQAIQYHQEFSRTLFAPADPTNVERVTSFMLRAESTSCPSDWIEQAPGVRWAEYGGVSPRDPTYLAPMSKVADALRETGWVWHDKRIGDGYGHVVHTAAAVGRPLIGHASHYAGLLAEPLWRDLETCIDLDRHSETDALRLWRAINADPEWYGEMVTRMQNTFARLVDFDAEADEIRMALAK